MKSGFNEGGKFMAELVVGWVRFFYAVKKHNPTFNPQGLHFSKDIYHLTLL